MKLSLSDKNLSTAQAIIDREEFTGVTRGYERDGLYFAESVEVWIDPMLCPSYILLLLGDSASSCRVHDPAENYKVVFSSATYDEAQTWLLVRAS